MQVFVYSDSGDRLITGDGKLQPIVKICDCMMPFNVVICKHAVNRPISEYLPSTVFY